MYHLGRVTVFLLRASFSRTDRSIPTHA